MELPSWESTANNDANATGNDLTFATASSLDLGLNTSIHRRGTLLSSMSQPLVTHSQVSYGAGKLNDSLEQRPRMDPMSSSLRGSFKGGHSTSNSASSSPDSPSVTSAISTDPSVTSSHRVSNPNNTTTNPFYAAEEVYDRPVDSSYIGDDHYWAGQQEKLRESDHALATSAVAIGGLPRPLDQEAHNPVSKSPSQPPAPPPPAQEVVASPSPAKVGSYSKSRPPVRTSPIDTINSSSGSSSGDENNFSTRNSSNNASTSKTSKLGSKKKKAERSRSRSQGQSQSQALSQSYGEPQPSSKNISFGMPPQFQQHRPPPQPTPQPSPKPSAQDAAIDFVDFIVAGLEQTISSIEALVVSEQSTAAIVYRDKPLVPNQTNSSNIIQPPAYDPAAITRLRNFVSSYLMGHNPSTEGHLSFGRSSSRKNKREPPAGELGRSLGELRSLVVDTLANSLNLCEAARRSATVERRQCREHLEKIQLQAAKMARKLGHTERAKRKKLEKENKALHKNLADDLENTIRDRCVAYETRCSALEDEISTLKMELSYMKNEAEKREIEHSNALEYAKYRATTDTTTNKQSEVDALKLALSQMEQKFRDYEASTMAKLKDVKEQERENQRKEAELYAVRAKEMEEKVKASEDRRVEQESRAKSILTEEVAKLRKNHEDAIASFRDQTYKQTSAASESLESERRRHEAAMEKQKSDAAMEIDNLKAAIELLKAEGRDNVREARHEAEARAGREARDQIRALTASHEAEMRRAGKEVVRLQKLLKRKGVSGGLPGDEFPLTRTSDPSDEDIEAISKVAPTSSSKTTTRSGKIAPGGGLAPTWLTAIDKGGDDLNVRSSKDAPPKAGSAVTNILRRSSELRDKIRAPLIPSSAPKVGALAGEAPPPPSRAAKPPGPAAAAPAPRSSDPPAPTKTSARTPPRIRHTQRNAPISSSGGEVLSVGQWQETLNLKESRTRDGGGASAANELDKYVTRNV